MSNTTTTAPLKLHPKVMPLPFTVQGPYVVLADGQLLAIDNHNILLSNDRGHSWAATPYNSTDNSPYAKDYKLSNERALIRTRSGVIVLAFVNLNELRWTWSDEAKDVLPGARLPFYITRSLDEGKTWEKPLMLHQEWTGDIRSMIQLQSGRLVVSTQQLIANHCRHGVITYMSDDDGASWQPSNLIDLGGRGHHDGACEATIEELPDGRVWMLIRTNLGHFWQAFSDDGRWWREIGPTTIDSSSSPGQLRRLKSGKLLLVWNRYSRANGETPVLRGGDGCLSAVPASWMRDELSLAYSEDDGLTWSEPMVVSSQKDVRHSYPHILEIEPGVIWISTMQGNTRIQIKESDF